MGSDVTATVVTPTTNDDGATYAVKLGGVTDSDGVIALSVGENVITVEVTAEDDSASKTYTVTVTRAAPVVVVNPACAPLAGVTQADLDAPASALLSFPIRTVLLPNGNEVLTGNMELTLAAGTVIPSSLIAAIEVLPEADGQELWEVFQDGYPATLPGAFVFRVTLAEGCAVE